MSYILNYPNWKKLFEADETNSAKPTISPLGDTGINVVIVPKDSAFAAPDNKPYILLIKEDVHFLAAPDNIETQIILDQANEKQPGVYKSTWDSEKMVSPVKAMISPGTDVTLTRALELIPQIVTTLYGGSATVSEDRVATVIKAIRLINANYMTAVSSNPIFLNIVARLEELKKVKDVNALLARVGNKPTPNMNEVFNGAKKALGS